MNDNAIEAIVGCGDFFIQLQLRLELWRYLRDEMIF